jgi:hypothetical protein
MNDLAAVAGWWWPFENACIVTPLPSLLARDDENRLHSESGPAIAYADAWSIFAIHGVLVNEQIVSRPETQTIKEIDSEANEEIKRIRTERFGWPRYLKETNAKVLDFRRNDIDGTDESLIQAKDGSRLLVCACPSTARVYAMRVERSIEKCESAQRWLHGERHLRIVGAS